MHATNPDQGFLLVIPARDQDDNDGRLVRTNPFQEPREDEKNGEKGVQG